MKAMIITAFGGPEVFQAGDWPKPQPGATELLVRIHAVALNPVDYKIREAGAWARVKPPAILGYDAAGVVEAVGASVKAFKPGDAVFYSPDIWGVPGACAEYHVVDESIVAHKPKSLTFDEAAALPLAGMTAWDAMGFLQLRPGLTVLIHGAAGGVGSLAVQMAKASGARVLGTCRAENRDLVRSLGVEVAIDYRAGDVAQAVLRETNGEGVDAVYDTVGNDTMARSIEALKPYGRAMTCVGITGELHGALFKNVLVRYGFMDRARHKLDTLSLLVARGQLRPVIDSIMPLAEVAEGHRRLQAGGLRGKIVLHVAD
jgi:NADPH:quinone reductase